MVAHIYSKTAKRKRSELKRIHPPVSFFDQGWFHQAAVALFVSFKNTSIAKSYIVHVLIYIIITVITYCTVYDKDLLS